MDPIRLELEAAVIEAPAASVDRATRTIEGMLSPWDELGVAYVDGEPRSVRFRRGSIVQARERVPMVLEHERGSPVGVLVELRDTELGLESVYRIDATPAGDDALVQAASGSRAGLTAGALADEYVETVDGTLEVISARLFHVGLTTIPAMPSAQVSRVAAANAEHLTEGSSVMTEHEATELAGTIGESTTDEALAELLEHENATVRQAAEAERDRRAAAASPTPTPTPAATDASSAEVPVVLNRHRTAAPELLCTAGELVLAMVAAQGGDRQAGRLVEAALSVLETADVPGLMPANYTSTILGEIPSVRPLADRVAVRRPMPASGMTLTKPRWTTKPLGGWVAENVAIPSNKPDVDLGDVAIIEWAYGVAMSYAVATRSSPDAIESIFRLAVEDYYSDVEQKIADLLMANDTPGAVGGGIGAAIAAFFASERTAPDLLVVAGDVYGDLVDVINTVPTYSNGTVSGATMTGTIAGLEIVVSPHLPAGAELVTARGAIELRESSPVRLTANVIGALQVELGATSFASFDLERPNAIKSLTPAAGSPAGSSEAKRSSKRKKDN